MKLNVEMVLVGADGKRHELRYSEQDQTLTILGVEKLFSFLHELGFRVDLPQAQAEAEAATRAENIAAKSKALIDEMAQQTETAPVPTEGRSKLRTVPKPPATKDEPSAEKPDKQRDIKPSKSEPAEAMAALDLENPPEEIVQASRLADVIHVLRKMGWTGIDAVVSACTSLRDRGNVPILKVASDLEARVRSTYEHLFPAAKDSA